MLLLKSFSFFLLFPVMILSYTDYTQTKPLLLEGTVVNEATGIPVHRALIYVSHGNEETLSNERGQFSLKTWHALPVILTVEQDGFKTAKLTITNISRNLSIRLKKN